MTRWWTYAILAIAIITGSVRAQPAPQTRETCELRESVNAAASIARKRNGKPAQHARRDASGASPHVVVPDLIDVPARSNAYVLVAFVVGEGRATVRAVRACSRAPPVG